MLHDYVHCDENKSYDDETIMMKANLAREKLFEIDIVRREMKNLVQEHCNLLVGDDGDHASYIWLWLWWWWWWKMMTITVAPFDVDDGGG